MTGLQRAALARMAWCGFCRDDFAVICQALPHLSAGQVVADVTVLPR